jgi:hypothetical protein
MKKLIELESGAKLEITIKEKDGCVTVGQEIIFAKGKRGTKTCTVTCSTGKSHTWTCADGKDCLGDCTKPDNPKGYCV